MRAMSSRFACCTASVTEEVQSDNDNVVIQRQRVVAGGADAVGRCGPGKHDRVHAEAAQHEIERGMEEGGEARLYYDAVRRRDLKLLRVRVGHAVAAIRRKRPAAGKPHIMAALSTSLPSAR